MLNSQVMLSATKVLAEKVTMSPAAEDASRVRELYVTFYGREATIKEVKQAEDFLKRFESVYAKAKQPRVSAWQSLCKALIAANEFIYVE